MGTIKTDNITGRLGSTASAPITLSGDTATLGSDVIMTQGSDATGDVYYRAADGKLTRLAAGAADTVLTSGGAGVVPTFAAAGGGMSVLSHQKLLVTVLVEANTGVQTQIFPIPSTTFTFNATLPLTQFYYLIANFNVSVGDATNCEGRFRLIDVTNSNTELKIGKKYGNPFGYQTGSIVLHHRFQAQSENSAYTLKLTMERMSGRVIVYGTDEYGATTVTLFKE